PATETTYGQGGEDHAEDVARTARARRGRIGRTASGGSLRPALLRPAVLRPPRLRLSALRATGLRSARRAAGLLPALRAAVPRAPASVPVPPPLLDAVPRSGVHLVHVGEREDHLAPHPLVARGIVDGLADHPQREFHL